MNDGKKVLLGLTAALLFAVSTLAFSRKPSAKAEITGVYSSQDAQSWDGLEGAILAPDSYYLGVSWINKSSTEKSLVANINLVAPNGSQTPYQLIQSTVPNEEVLAYISVPLSQAGNYSLECDLHEEATMAILDSKEVVFSVQAAPPPAQGQITNVMYQMPGSSQQLALSGASFLSTDIGKTITIFVAWKNLMTSGSLMLNNETVVTCKLPNQTTGQCTITSGIGVAVAAGGSGVLQTTLKLIAEGSYIITAKIGA
jgi:hypothetical protein